VRWWLLRQAEAVAGGDPVPAEAQVYCRRLLERCPAIAEALTVAAAFIRLVRQRDVAALASWLVAARHSPVVECREFALGIARDRAAVEAALTSEWSTGPVEGQITKLKLVKRAMYGRASLPLLRARLLRAA
jgi:transposase